jgi:hypothetical protein
MTTITITQKDQPTLNAGVSDRAGFGPNASLVITGSGTFSITPSFENALGVWRDSATSITSAGTYSVASLVAAIPPGAGEIYVGMSRTNGDMRLVITGRPSGVQASVSWS